MVKWRKFILNQRKSELWAAEDNVGSTAMCLLITVQNKTKQQKENRLYVEISHLAYLEERCCLTEKSLGLKKRKINKSQLKISHTPTTPSQMYGCLEKPPWFFKVSRKSVKKYRRNTDAHEEEQVCSQTAPEKASLVWV